MGKAASLSMIAVSTLISFAVAPLLACIPSCHTLVTTGEKASALAAQAFHCPIPPVGGWVDIAMPDTGTSAASLSTSFAGLTGESPCPLRFWRMPSTSRAYPLPLEKKAEAYRKLF